MKKKTLENRCKALTKAGKRCRAAATPGGLCFFHANPNKAAELGRIGGRRKIRSSNSEPLPILDSARGVRDTVARLIVDIYEGKCHPSIAAGLASLMNLQLRAIQMTSLDERVRKLEERSNMNSPDTSNNKHAETSQTQSPLIQGPESSFAEDDPVQPSAEP